MKPPIPDVQNIQILKRAGQIIRLPFTFVAAGFAWLLGLSKSKKDLRAEDSLRQSRARRKLRKLPPDHVQRPPSDPAT